MFRKGGVTLRSGAALAVVVLCLVSISSAVDMVSAKERTCEDMSSHAVSVDLEWVKGVKIWYYSHMSRYDLYTVAELLLKRNASEITEDEVYYEACVTWELFPELMSYGYGGEQVGCDTQLVDGLSTVEYLVNGKREWICWTTLTDNKSFLLQICCYANNQMTWYVGSTISRLPEDTVKQIHEHVTGLGFHKEHFTSLRFETCNPFARKPKPVKDISTCEKEDSKCDCKNNV